MPEGAIFPSLSEALSKGLVRTFPKSRANKYGWFGLLEGGILVFTMFTVFNWLFQGNGAKELPSKRGGAFVLVCGRSGQP